MTPDEATAILRRHNLVRWDLDPAAPDYDAAKAIAWAERLKDARPLPSRGGGASRPGDAPAPPTIPAAEQARLAVLVNRCPAREPIRCGCADRRALCKLDPERPAEKTHADCLECRRSSPA